MPIYDRPTKALMAEWAQQNVKIGEVFDKSTPVRWFGEHYPKIKTKTVEMHVEGMATNNPVRKHHSIRAGAGFDVFFKVAPGKFRLYDPSRDPYPLYTADMKRSVVPVASTSLDREEDAASEDAGATEFAFERDLRNYLVKNLALIEPGLRLYEEEGITGVEFPVGGRYIDILAVAQDDSFVVIELKVSRGYDRAIGQLLRYMGWVAKNMQTTKLVRGVIVANEITEDLKLASSRLTDIRLIEYEMSFKLRPV
jgi:hypothetical protein